MQNPLISGLAELGKYLGSRLERIESAVKSTPQKIQLDVGDVSKSVKEFSEGSKKLLALIPDALKNNNKEVREAVKELTSTLDAFQGSLSKSLANSLPPYTEMMMRSDRHAGRQMEVLEKIPKTISLELAALSQTISNTNKETANGLEKVSQHLSGQTPIDLSPLILAISRVEQSLNQKPADLDDKAIIKVLKEIKEEFKGMTYKNAPQFIGGGGGQILAKSVSVANVTMTSANTEYSYSFPSGTLGFEVRLRDTDQPLLIAYATGKLPTSGDGSAYFTVPAYYIQSPNTGVSWTGKTIYLQAGAASQVAEFVVYKAA